ncbi:MAG: hypothetical protein AAB416_00040, partial [Patescibacteria group bacterium]
MIAIIARKNLWLSISGLMVVCAVGALLLWQLKLGIDFTGGSLLELTYTSARPSHVAIQERLDAVDMKEVEMKDS